MSSIKNLLLDITTNFIHHILIALHIMYYGLSIIAYVTFAGLYSIACILYYGMYVIACLKICAYCHKTIWYWQKGKYTYFHVICREKAINDIGDKKY